MPPKHVPGAVRVGTIEKPKLSTSTLRSAPPPLQRQPCCPDRLGLLLCVGQACDTSTGPGGTEAGSAGAQPHQGITRSRVCRKALQGPGTGEPGLGAFSPFGHPSHALKIQPSPSRLLPLSPASGLSTVAETYFMFLRSSIVNLALLSSLQVPDLLPAHAGPVHPRSGTSWRTPPASGSSTSYAVSSDRTPCASSPTPHVLPAGC